MELKPAHETMLASIERHCGNLVGVESAIANGATLTDLETIIPPGGLEMYRADQIGGLCSLLDTLKVTIITNDKLDETIARLTGLDYEHAVIYVTIKSLEKRPR